MSRQWRRYRTMATTSLLGLKRALSKPGLRWLFADQISAIEFELTIRELPLIADECGGHLVPWILGTH